MENITVARGINGAVAPKKVAAPVSEEVRIRRRANFKRHYYSKGQAAQKERRDRNREQINAYHRRYTKLNYERFKRWNKKSWLKRKYGITIEAFEALLQVQNFECGICDGPLKSEGQGTHIDHDHATGRIRGILCAQCNRGLGHMRDNVSFLRKAIEYLERKQ